MSEQGLFQLFRSPKYRSMMIMYAVGMLMAVFGLILLELKIVGMWMTLVGIILWAVAEGQIIRAVQSEQ